MIITDHMHSESCDRMKAHTATHTQQKTHKKTPNLQQRTTTKN